LNQPLLWRTSGQIALGWRGVGEPGQGDPSSERSIAGETTRREIVLYGAAATLALRGWGATPGWARQRPPALIRGGRFAEGVTSGASSLGGFTLWTRLSEVEGPARIEAEVAKDAGFDRIVARRRLLARPTDDRCVHLHLDAGDLEPARRYWYRFSTATKHSPVGTFRTLPPAGSTDPVRIGFWSCQSWVEGRWAAHLGLAAEPDLDLVVCLGDYIYEYGGPSNFSGRDDFTGGNGTAYTLDDYRAKYRLYRTDSGLRALHRKHAMCFLWDDHEVTNDYWRRGDNATVTPGFPARRAAAYRAWFEHQPVRRIPAGSISTRIYRRLEVGRLAELFFIDCRQYRDPQPCSNVPLTPCPTRNDPRTMLGRRQKRWLKRSMRRSAEPWKVLVNGLMLAGLDQPAPGTSKWVDTWDGYGAERAELVSFWRRRDVRNVIVMTGDEHDNYAGTVTTTGRVDGEPGAIEFVIPSVSSLNTGEYLGSPAAARVSEDNARALNRHLELVDQQRHGYCVLELSRNEARVRFRHVADHLDPRSPVSTSYELRVPRGRLELETV
jgi:alkaline phosphatase D